MIHTLASGLRVCTRPMPGIETATVTLLVDAGSRHEAARVNGIAHLFEHMVFKGAGGRSAREISETIEDVGGELNACTERDATSFTASVLAEHVPLGVELLADLSLRAHLTEEDLEREKQVVLQELAEAEDTPSDIIFDELWTAAFPGQPLGRSILGSKKSLSAITAADLKGWRETHYAGSSTILVAAGKVDPDAFLKLAEVHFSGLPTADRSPVQAAHFAPVNRIRRMSAEQAHVTLALKGPATLDPSYLAARLFADVVGGGASSRLFQHLREDRGLAYSVSAALQPYSDTGIFYAHAATARADGAKTLKLMREVIDAAAEQVTERELSRAKNQARAGLLSHLETSWGQASSASRQIALYGRLRNVAEICDELAAVNLSDVRSAASAMLEGPMAVATIGVPAARAA